MVDKVIATPVALELIALLKTKYGPQLMFHQSGGCCDNSAANCYLPGEITMGAGDEYLGDIGGCPFYIGKAQYVYWQHTQLIIDVIEKVTTARFHLKAPRARRVTPAQGYLMLPRWPRWASHRLRQAAWRIYAKLACSPCHLSARSYLSHSY